MCAITGEPGTAIRIGPRHIGPGAPPLVVAELSGNHGGSLDGALRLVRAAAGAGAEAIKLQTYRPDTMTLDTDDPDYRLPADHPMWPGRTLWDLYTEAHTPWEWHEPIFELASELGVLAFSAPFDVTAVDLLERLGAPVHKVASSEIVDLPLIEAMAATGKPVIISTGMASMGEIERAVDTVRATGNDHVLVLACTAAYPAYPTDSNLRSIPVLAEALGVPVGLSDHTRGLGPALAAVGLGAVVVEKHVALTRTDGPIDAQFSLVPSELALLVEGVHDAWLALGTGQLGPAAGELGGLRFRRSLRVVRDVAAGERVTPDNVRSLRPAGGLPPSDADLVMGRAFTRSVTQGEPLTWDVL